MFKYGGMLEFDEQSEYFVRDWICNGWICAQSKEQCLYALVRDLHVDYSVYRIARQLLALGLFREPEPQEAKLQQLRWPLRCFYDEDYSRFIHCDICRIGHKQESTQECPLVAPLMTEFFRNPLSLQQLSRIEIRRSVGMNDFERRVKTLSLPPLLLSYVWRANELLQNGKSAVKQSPDRKQSSMYTSSSDS